MYTKCCLKDVLQGFVGECQLCKQFDTCPLWNRMLACQPLIKNEIVINTSHMDSRILMFITIKVSVYLPLIGIIIIIVTMVTRVAIVNYTVLLIYSLGLY